MSERLARLKVWMRQLLCRHEEVPTKFQALVGPVTYECVHCGKRL